MNATTSAMQAADMEFVLLCGITPDTYRRILDAIGDFHLRHTYDGCTLEIRRLLHGVPPESYRKLLDALPNHYLQHSYDGWTLEMMTPRFDHEWVKGLLGRMLEAMALALDIPLHSVGSTTLCAAADSQGLQPDESYYIGPSIRAHSQGTFRPGEDPPPDLTIEVDVTSSVVPRLPLYAQIGVPEIWRHSAGQIRFYRLSEKREYVEIDCSVAFPFIKPGDIQRFVEQRHEKSDNAIVREFVAWAQDAYAARKS